MRGTHVEATHCGRRLYHGGVDVAVCLLGQIRERRCAVQGPNKVRYRLCRSLLQSPSSEKRAEAAEP